MSTATAGPSAADHPWTVISDTNTAVAVVLTAVLALALVAVFAGLRAAHNQRRAQAAEAEDQERLRIALTEEARAVRLLAPARSLARPTARQPGVGRDGGDRRGHARCRRLCARFQLCYVGQSSNRSGS